MKLAWKISVLLIITGLFLFGAFYFINGGSVPGSADEEYEQFDVTYDDLFDSINLLMSNRSVYVHASDTDQIRIVYYQSQRDYFEIDTTTSTLKVENQTEPRITFGWFWWIQNQEVLDVHLYLPIDSLYDLEVRSSNGKITVDQLTQLGKVELRSSNGELTIKNVPQIQELRLVTSNGAITLQNVSITNSSNLTTSNGKIKLTQVETHNMIATTSNGGIETMIVGAKENYKIDVSTSNGSIYLDDLKIGNQVINPTKTNLLRLKTSNGTIRIQFQP